MVTNVGPEQRRCSGALLPNQIWMRGHRLCQELGTGVMPSEIEGLFVNTGSRGTSLDAISGLVPDFLVLEFFLHFKIFAGFLIDETHGKAHLAAIVKA